LPKLHFVPVAQSTAIALSVLCAVFIISYGILPNKDRIYRNRAFSAQTQHSYGANEKVAAKNFFSCKKCILFVCLENGI